MKIDKPKVYDYFRKLGLGAEVAEIYLSLYVHGPQSLSELSRSSHVERTRIYRLLDNLKASKLIEVENHNKRGVMRAAPITNLSILISQKEQELKELHDGFSATEHTLGINSISNSATRVQFYQGAEGYKQMFWNEAAAKIEVLCITYEITQPKTNTTFFDRCIERSNDHSVHFREVHGDAFRKSKLAWRASHSSKPFKFYEARYISDKTFNIRYSADVYNDVVAFYNWKDGEIFGIEIYNQDIADGQRQFFELLWDKAEPEALFSRS